MKFSHPRRAICCFCVALVLTGCATAPSRTRITGPVDTSRRLTLVPPETGVLSGGGVFHFTTEAVQDDLAMTCIVQRGGDITDLFLDPLEMQKIGREISVSEEARDALTIFLESVVWRMAANGTLVVFADEDPSGSLPWTGNTTGGDAHRLQASTVRRTVADRSLSVLASFSGDATENGKAKVSVNWDESTTVSLWLVRELAGVARCNAELTMQLVRKEDAPVLPSFPEGDAELLSTGTVLQEGSRLAEVVDLLGRATWQYAGVEEINLQTSSGEGVAFGTIREQGNAYVLFLSGEFAGDSFALRAVKTEEGRVRGTLQAAGRSTAIELAG